MSRMLELAEMCEKATEPDREIELAIWRLIDPRAAEVEAEGRTPLPWLYRYTASLDAAMTLVPEMCLPGFKALWDGESAQAYRGSVDRYERRDGLLWKENFLSLAATPALALCAAALRARASQEGEG